MFETIVWATDGSACADRALDLVRSIAQHERSDVHAVHVLERLATGAMAGPRALVDEDGILKQIEARSRRLREEGIHCTLHVISADAGKVAAQIAEVAGDYRADVIVAGTRGHAPAAGLLLGGVTQRLLHTARCPVLVVPPAAPIEPAAPSALAVSSP